MRKITISALMLLLAACGSRTADDAGNTTANPAAGADYGAEVAGLPAAQRDAVFLRAIRDAGLDCQGVTASERLKDVGGRPTWRATCSDRVSHLVQVTADGTAVVTSRTTP